MEVEGGREHPSLPVSLNYPRFIALHARFVQKAKPFVSATSIQHEERLR